MAILSWSPSAAFEDQDLKMCHAFKTNVFQMFLGKNWHFFVFQCRLKLLLKGVEFMNTAQQFFEFLILIFVLFLDLLHKNLGSGVTFP